MHCPREAYPFIRYAAGHPLQTPYGSGYDRIEYIRVDM